MFDVKIDTTETERYITEQIPLIIKEASDAAVKAAAEYALNPIKENLSYTGNKGDISQASTPIGKLGTRTGLLLSQTKIKWFHQRNGLMGAAIKVQGVRKFVMHIHEYGTKSHGRLPKADTKGLTRNQRRQLGALRGNSALPARQVFALTWQAIQATTSRIYVEVFDRHFQQKQDKS